MKALVILDPGLEAEKEKVYQEDPTEQTKKDDMVIKAPWSGERSPGVKVEQCRQSESNFLLEVVPGFDCLGTDQRE